MEKQKWSQIAATYQSLNIREPCPTPYAFTENGAITAASMLNTSRAVEMINDTQSFIR
jgi:hypothetical protein